MQFAFYATLLRQVSSALFTIWLAVTLTFLVLRLLPGSAIEAQFAQSGVPQEVIERRRDALGLDDPVYQQYADFLGDIMRGHLGESLYSGQTVNTMIVQRLDSTLELAGWSFLLAVVSGICAGLLAGTGTGLLSHGVRFLIDLSISVPVYWSGTLVLFVLVAAFGGQRDLIWPVLVLGFHSAGSIARLLQTEIQQIQHAPFVRTAYSKGLSRLQVAGRHMLPVALVPVIQVIALQAGILFSGTIITETLFSRPGLGLMLWNATLERDYPVVQGVVILIATTYIILNTLSHLLSQMLDPRLRQTA